MMAMSDLLQAIIDRRADATPGPAFAESMTDYSPAVTTWIVPDVVRSKYGNNALNFDEDEGTARFVAAAFTDVTAMAGALLRARAHLAAMEQALASGETLDPRLFELAAAGLRNALKLDGGQ
jgi:hypothetical protein